MPPRSRLSISLFRVIILLIANDLRDSRRQTICNRAVPFQGLVDQARGSHGGWSKSTDKHGDWRKDIEKHGVWSKSTDKCLQGARLPSQWSKSGK